MAKKSIKDITQAQERVKQIAKAVDNIGYATLLVCLSPFLAPLLLHIGDNTKDPGPHTVPGFALALTAYFLAQYIAVILMGKVDRMNIEKELLKEES